MILSQEHKKKHYFFLSKRIVVCFLISITLTNAYAQTQRGRKDDAKAEATRIKESALSEIEQEKEKARQDLRDQVAALAISGAEQILMREVDQAAHNEVLAKISQQL